MQKVRFIKEPGYLFDLFYVFLLYFNKDYCLKYFVNGNKSAEDTEFFENVLRDYEEIPKDLLPFFYIKENGRSFMTQTYINNRNQELVEGYNLAAIQEEIRDHKQVVLNLIQFYFPDADKEAIVQSEKSMALLDQLIKESDYDDSLKSGLYSFFINPAGAIQKLYYELMKKEFQLSQQYEKSGISKVQQQFDLQETSEKWAQNKYCECNIDDYEIIYVTFCVLAKNCTRYELFEDSILLMLGTDYMAYMEFSLLQNRVPELDIIGNALAEKNRVAIFDLIWKKKEVTIKDIEQTLKFTGTNSYYHLSLMLRANLLSSRNQGRTVLYSINKQCIAAVCEMLQRYAG